MHFKNRKNSNHYLKTILPYSVRIIFKEKYVVLDAFEIHNYLLINAAHTALRTVFL